jgi:cytochrome c5
MRTLSLALIAFGIAALPLAAQDLPAGPAKETFENVCSQCHGLDVIVSQKHTKPEWKAVVDTMASYGASAKDEEFDAIIDYLAKNFGKSDTASNWSRRPAPLK